jgi:hypothetical protein
MYGVSRPFTPVAHVYDLPHAERGDGRATAFTEKPSPLCGYDANDRVETMDTYYESVRHFLQEVGTLGDGHEGVCPNCLYALDQRHNLPTDALLGTEVTRWRGQEVTDEVHDYLGTSGAEVSSR